METQQAEPTAPISLYDAVLWALRQPGLRSYTHDELCALFHSYADDAYVFTDESRRNIIGTALATRVSEDVVRIPYIASDRSPAAIRRMVETLRNDFTGAKVIAFKRRGKECVFKIEQLERLLRLAN